MGDTTGDYAEDENLVDCEHCGRHFKADRIETHEWICKKHKLRKPFDVCQQRIKGTEVEEYLKKAKPHTKTEKHVAPQKDWRKEHEEFINNLRAARQATAILKRGGTVKDLPPLPPSDYSNYIQCPTCHRKFNNSAAERHIPKCADMQHTKPKPKPKPAKPPTKSGITTRTTSTTRARH